MGVDIERDETGIRDDLPPSYQTLLGQHTNDNEVSTQNRNYINCELCKRCLSEAKQKTGLLIRHCRILEAFSVNIQGYLAIQLVLILFIALSYFYYLWKNTPTKEHKFCNNKNNQNI